MLSRYFLRSSRVLALVVDVAPAFDCERARREADYSANSIPDADADHVKERNEWFFRGRLVHGKPSAELRRRAYQAKLQMRAQRAAACGHAG